MVKAGFGGVVVILTLVMSRLQSVDWIAILQAHHLGTANRNALSLKLNFTQILSLSTTTHPLETPNHTSHYKHSHTSKEPGTTS